MKSVGIGLKATVSIREILPNEEKEVRELYQKSLGPIDELFFLLAFKDALKCRREQRGTNLVALLDGRVVGSVSLRIVIIEEKKVGLIDAIVTDKDLRGKGIGKSLLDSALAWFRERGCEAFYATADRYNSPSWNIFIHRGFTPYGLRSQLKDFGVNFIRLWFTEFYIVGAGTFFLKKEGVEMEVEMENVKEGGEAWYYLAAWLGSALLWCAPIRILTMGLDVFLPIVPSLFAAVGLSVFVHEFGHKLAARRFGLETTFKVWDSGLLFSFLLTLFFAGFYPAYGSTYIKRVDWRYNPGSKEIGWTYAAGPMLSLSLAYTLWAFQMVGGNGLFSMLILIGYQTSLILTIFNLLPIKASGGFAWDGRKIYTWNKTVWSLLVVGCALLILSNILL